MAKVNAQTESFIFAKLAGYDVLYSDLRVDRATVPEGIYAYDIRHGDEDWGYAAELKEYVLVNHMATILCDQKIEFPENEDTLVLEDNLTFIDYSMSLEDYQKRSQREELNMTYQALE